MSEYQVPPSLEPGYAQYPRGSLAQVYGSSERLARLYRGYHGMSYTLLFVLLFVICAIAPSSLKSSPGIEIIGILLALIGLVLLGVSLFFGVRSDIDIGFGIGWSQGVGAVLGFLSPLVGLLMIATMQHLATSEMKKYGIPAGVKGKYVKARIAELVAIENASRPAQFAP